MKLLNVVAETDSDLFFDEIGFNVEVPQMTDLRYAFLVSAAQVFRCCGRDDSTGLRLVRDRSNWPIGHFDSVPGLGFAALAAACGRDLGMVSQVDAEALARDCVTTLLGVPAHRSGFLPHWTRIVNGAFQRHPDSEISTVDTSLAYISAYTACSMLGLETERQQILTRIRSLDFAAVTTANNEISHGFDKSGSLIDSTWTSWGGETQLVLLLGKMNNPAMTIRSRASPCPTRFARLRWYGIHMGIRASSPPCLAGRTSAPTVSEWIGTDSASPSCPTRQEPLGSRSSSAGIRPRRSCRPAA